jgi:uncharacterized membrane protein
VSDVPPPPPPPPGGFGTPPPASSPDVGAALSYGWKKFQENVGPLIIAFIIPAVVSAAFSIFGRLFNSFALSLVISIISFLVVQAVGIAIYRVALQITAGEPADIGKAFTYDRWGEWILFSIVFGLMVGIGLVLCIIPGLFVLAFFGLAPFFFLDQNMSLGQALTASREVTSSNGLAFPVLLSIVVGFLGVIACCIGVLVTAPIAYVAVAFLYRYAVGQQVAA